MKQFMSDHNLVINKIEDRCNKEHYSTQMINKEKVYKDNLEYNLFITRNYQNKFLSK